MRLEKIRISARISDLARLQAYQVGDAIQKKYPDIQVEYLFRKSLGDINLQDPLWKMPEKGVFTEDFLQDLLTQQTDLVVHSWKDLPTERNPQTEIVATLPRADQRDLLLMKESAWGTSALKIFSSSPRREYNLTRCLPELLPWGLEKLEFLPVRGNVQTRVRKWKEDTDIHGLIVAKAAMDRLLQAEREEFQETRQFLRAALSGERWMALPLSVNPTAAAQGALAIEVHRDRNDLKEILKSINSESTFKSVQEERRILRQYGGGCHQKIGVSVIDQKNGRVLSLQGLTDSGETLGTWELKTELTYPQFNSSELGVLMPEMVERTQTTPELSTGVGYWIARSEAWPQTAAGRKQIIWSAGLQTWKKLARRGVWVHGTSDGLGEELPVVTPLVGHPVEWYKLTHQKSGESSLLKTIVSYSVDFRSEDEVLKELASKKMLYWRSGSQFTWVTSQMQRLGLKLQADFHACGPGSTYEFLQTQVPKENLFVFLSETDWRNKCQV